MYPTWIFTILLSLTILSLPAQAQTFEDGYQSYVRNQFPVAELQFKNALKKASAQEEKGFILKFIGICQFMRGDKKNAGISFNQSLSMDRSIQIDAEEVLDPTVVTFFNQIKSRLPPEVKRKPKPDKLAIAPALNPAQAPLKKKAKGKKKSQSSLGLTGDQTFEQKPRSIGILHFLPLGLPQFANSSYIMGSAFAGLQLFSLYTIGDAEQQSQERRALNKVVRLKEGLTDEQRNDFYRENDAFIDELKQQKNLAIAGFSALWVISIAEGIINNKGSATKTANDKVTPPNTTMTPIIQANSLGGGFGISFQTQLK